MGTLLIGYTIRKRPLYGSLLDAIKRKQNFKGALELLTLQEDFFFFSKFPIRKTMVWFGITIRAPKW